MAFSTASGSDTFSRPPGRGISLRRGTLEDETATFEVMRRAMGYDMNWHHHVETRKHLRHSANASYWLAEETPRFGRPRVVGYAHSIVRESVWNLTEFFVMPSHHRQGIGGALLLRCLDDGAQAGATTRLVLASQHGGADSLYIRHAGCYPRLPMILLAGPTTSLFPPIEEGPTCQIEDAVVPSFQAAYQRARAGEFRSVAPVVIAEPMRLSNELLAEVNAVDREIVGYARPEEHALWTRLMGGETGAARLFRRAIDGRLVGYAYFGAHSSGPALAGDPALLPAFIAHVAAISRQYARARPEFGFSEPVEHHLALAGTNEIVLDWLLRCGWQIVFQYLFMSSRPLGQLDRYVCHNPLYVL